MAATLSIIIPVLNAEAQLPATLDALLPGVAAGVIREVIVSDGGSTDRSVDLARLAGCEVLSGPPGRGGQLARGAEMARGDWFLFLHADTILPEVWVGAVGAHMAQATDAAAFRLQFNARGVMPSVVAGWANLRSHVFGLPYGDQGLLIARNLYREVGGYQRIPLMEDVAIARALRGRLRLLPETVATDAQRYLDGGWIRRGGRNLWTLMRYLLGADSERLAQSYRKR